MPRILTTPGAALATAAARIRAQRVSKILASIHAELDGFTRKRPIRKVYKPTKYKKPSIRVSHIGPRRRPKRK